MKTLYLDPFSGISGDMLIGVLLDLGLNFEQLQTALAELRVTGYALHHTEDVKSAIKGTSFHVTLTGQYAHHHSDEGLGAMEQQQPVSAHHDVAEEGSSGHHHHHDHQHHDHHGRNLADIEKILMQAHLDDHIKASALAVFQDIATAEAHVHQKPLEEVHFHEVGAIDSIVDIVGALLGLQLMGIDQVVCGELVDGTGTIEVAHGRMPVPVPAVMQMRVHSEVPMRQRLDVTTELVTPTGFALVKQLAHEFGPLPADKQVVKVGYGFGTRETGHLNALRGVLLEDRLSQQEVATQADEIIELHANLDDQTGEELAYVMEQLMTQGAKDVYYTPIFGKKNRPGYELTVLTDQRHFEGLKDQVCVLTTTFGVRWHTMQRTIFQRHFDSVTTPYGELPIKVGTYHHQQKIKVEYDAAAQAAAKHHVSLQQVTAAAKLNYLKSSLR